MGLPLEVSLIIIQSTKNSPKNKVLCLGKQFLGFRSFQDEFKCKKRRSTFKYLAEADFKISFWRFDFQNFECGRF